jgi:DNA-binding protein YbaB
MHEEDLEAVARLLEESDSLARMARAAARMPADPGSDATGSVTVTLDERGQVATVKLAASWRRRLGPDRLAEAVVEAVADASTRRLAAWAAAYGEGSGRSLDAPSADADLRPADNTEADAAVWDRGDFQRKLQEVATAPMSEADRLVALTGLLEIIEDIERGLDEVSGKLRAAVTSTFTGHSPGRHVTATVTGTGQVTAIRIDRTWMNEAHEINIGRHLAAAIRAANDQLAAQGVNRLVAESPLGNVQRAAQDPLGLARRLRLSD